MFMSKLDYYISIGTPFLKFAAKLQKIIESTKFFHLKMYAK